MNYNMAEPWEHFCCCSVAKLCWILRNSMNCSMPGFPVLHYLPEFVQSLSIGSVMASNHLILCHPLLLLPSIFPSIRVFSNEWPLHIKWPKYWSFSISPSSEYSGLISFRIDWFDCLAVQGTVKSLLQHHSSKTPILWHSVFFMVQLSHTYMITGWEHYAKWNKPVTKRKMLFVSTTWDT